METFQFKTNIKCGGCIATVTPHLNAVEGIEKWNVDTQNPDKVLTVEACDLSAVQVAEVVEKAGFKAQPL
jgi:copper chaperone